jgi:hypothetical protein
MPSEQELLDRIRQLEAENSELRDKLDMIYAIVAPEEAHEFAEPHDAEDGGPPDELIQITGGN